MRKAWVALILAIVGCSGQANATTQTTPTAVADYGPPPSEISLLYLADPRHSGWYVGFDWSGHPRGTIKTTPLSDPNGMVAQAPDGSAFAVAPAAKGGYQEFLDRLGNAIPNQDPTLRYQDQIWAEDSKHLCTLGGNGLKWQIGLKSPGAAPTVHSIPSNLSAAGGIIAVAFRSCSVAYDRAVLVNNYTGRPTDLYLVRISDGAVLLRQSHPAETLGDITASVDGVLIAESSIKSTGYLTGNPEPYTTIWRVVDGKVLAKLDPSYGVLAFSADDTSVLVSTTPWAAGTATHLALVSLLTQSVLWRYDGNRELAGYWVRPYNSDIAVMLQDPADQSRHAIVDALIVHQDGTSTQLQGHLLRP